MKRRISFSILVVLLAGLFISLGTVRKVPAKSGRSNASPVPAKSGCSNASLRGSYGLQATGTTPAGGPFAAVGVFSFDGAGSLTGTLFVRVTGTTIPNIPVSGTYTVNSDCTVSDTWGGSQHESVIVDDGQGYLILNTSDGVISGEAKKQIAGRGEDD
jgi:hypothetical protein